MGWGARSHRVVSRLHLPVGKRALVLAACIVLASGCSAGTLSNHTWAEYPLSFAVALLLTFFVLRHMGLAALVSGAPFAGILACSLLGPMLPDQSWRPIAYAGGVVAGTLIALEIGSNIIAGAGNRRAALAGLSRYLRTVIAATVVGVVPALVSNACRQNSALLNAAVALILEMASAAALVPLCAGRLHYDEGFVSRSNRTREWFARLVSPLLPVAQRRYGASISGVACVIAAILFFDTQPFSIGPGSALAASGSAAFVVLVAATQATVRDVRRTVAVLAASGPPILAACWFLSHVHMALDQRILSGLTTGVALGAMFHVALAHHAGIDASSEDEVVAGSKSAMELFAVPFLVLAAGSAALVLATLPDWKLSVCLAMLLLGQAVSAIVFQPAFAIVIESLWPRRQTLEARYRVK